jgi:subtilisin-like proprotein convertase family protein
MNGKTPTNWRTRAGLAAMALAVLTAGLGPGAAGVDAARNRVTPRQAQSFGNGTPITITDNTTSTPSAITVSGMNGTVASVVVGLNVFSHSQPADVDILLVGPQGQTATILSDVAGASKAENDSLLLSDAAAQQLPRQDDLTSGKFQPTNYEFTNDPDKFAPHPRIPTPLPSGSALAVFNGTNPNGEWLLFVDDSDDDATDTFGSLAQGWSLNITTANGVPVTSSDRFEVQAGKTLTVPAAGVLDNDSDPDGDTLTAILSGSPRKGTVDFQPDGSFVYKAKKKAKGSDSFTYLVKDPTGLTALDTVTIQIKGKKHKKKGRK